MENIDFEAFAKKAAQIAMDKKVERASILDVRPLTEMTNFFVIATANSAAQINAVCDGIESKFKEEGLQLIRREDRSSQNWRVIDYGGIIIHIMTAQSRQIYKLEDFWQKAKEIQFEEDKPIGQDVKATKKTAKKTQIAKSKSFSKKSKSVKKKTGKVKKTVKKNLTKKAKLTKKKPIKKLKSIKKIPMYAKKSKKVIKNAKKK